MHEDDWYLRLVSVELLTNRTYMHGLIGVTCMECVYDDSYSLCAIVRVFYEKSS